MTATAARNINVNYSGDVDANNNFPAASNTTSPATISVINLTNGPTTITPPDGGTTPKGVTIIPPVGNVADITLKGVTGDTGVLLHPTDPTSLGLGSTTGTFVLTATTGITGVRLFWS